MKKVFDGNSHKNSEGYCDPTAYEAERHIKAQFTGKKSRIQGNCFENLISAACFYYADRGIAKIEKTPEPMKPIGAKNRQGQFLACYTKQAQPDYKGTLKGGRAIVFEAKHTDSDRIEQRRLTQEQTNDLETHYSLGAVAFVLVSFGMYAFYRIPWPIWRNMGDIYGRKYIKQNELNPYEVQIEHGYIKLLDKLDFLGDETDRYERNLKGHERTSGSTV